MNSNAYMENGQSLILLLEMNIVFHIESTLSEINRTPYNVNSFKILV